MLSKAGLGDFANSMLPGGSGSGPELPEGVDMEELQRLAAANGGRLPPEVMQQYGLGPAGGGKGRPGAPSRPKKDRKKEKAKRKKGRKRR
jgi:hypothetical protein